MKMSIYVATLLWIVIPILVLGLLGFIFSGGDGMAIFIIGMYSLIFVGWAIFLSFSFLLGYKAGAGAMIAVPVLLLLAGVYLWQVSSGWVEPGTLWRETRSLVIFFVILLSAGMLCRWGLRANGFAFIGAILLTAITILACIIICLSKLSGAYSPIPREPFWKEVYAEKMKNGTTYFHDEKMILDPFTARVIGVYRFNNTGAYVGFSTSQYEEHKIVNNFSRPDSAERATTCDYIHDRYVPLLDDFMADCHDALYIKKENCCVFLYLKDGKLCRKEFDYYPNGVVKQVHTYTYDAQTGFHVNEYDRLEFDELGFSESRGVIRWRVQDFHESDDAVNIEHRYGQPYDPAVPKENYTDSQQTIIDRFLSVKNQTPPEKYSSLAFPLDQYYKIGGINGNIISIYIKPDAYKWLDTDTHGFTPLETVEQMYSFVDALELSRLETGMWERIGEQSHVVGVDDECSCFMIKENIEDGKTLVFYFFGDAIVTVDSRFCFRFDPSVHQDAELQQKAVQSWDAIKDLVKQYN